MAAVSSMQGQVLIDRAIQLTGAGSERQVEGVAMPSSGTAAVTVEHAILGTGTWAQASQVGDQLFLTTQPVLTDYRPGTLIRFKNPASTFAPTTIQCDALLSIPVLRPDGLPPYPGQMVEGAISEVMIADGHWVLLNGVEHGCPAGFTQVNDAYCIGTDHVVNKRFFPAVDHCTSLGGRLCTWDEYYAACVLVGDQLLGLFDGWEWIDDSSNHGHTGDQAGNTNCTDQTWFNLNQSAPQARCCYSLR